MNKKKSLQLKRYLYVSQHKIGIYDSQIVRNPIQRLCDWILRIPSVKMGVGSIGTFELNLPAQSNPELYQKMQQIIDKIKEDYPVGTVDKPAAYIHDTLPMFQVLMPSRPTYRREGDDLGFVYFGGGTSQTSLGLVGSLHHLTSAIPDEKARLHSSDVPRLVQYINKRINEIVPGKPPRYDGLGAVWHADVYNTDLRTPVEFFAARLHDSKQPQGIPSQDKRVLLYTPIYIAYADE